MLSTNSAPWPIASSHQHQTNPYHALHSTVCMYCGHHCYSALCTLYALVWLSLTLSPSHPLLKLRPHS